MTESQREQVDELFGDLCEVGPAEREVALAAVQDAEVRARVEVLLSHAVTADKGLNTSIAEVMRAASVSGAFDDRTVGVGTRFERYRIERKIGQGGMGDVYEAVRENDFHKRVALKIVRYGLDSEFARARFQQERQTLAGLEHPYIARLLDGGEAANGCPYLVLEFVDGAPIDAYCERRSREEILRLFLKVCEAVEYAHRNLVVHRDLKPGNILVTAEGEPKLLDFGIAKLLEPGAEVTQTRFVALSPQYASPEQVRGATITTASDVYSLGVILYVLLTGRKPYQIETANALEMERVVCHEAPAPAELGDELDDILMMALRKEPERRYSGVQPFADDIARYMDGRPVSAAPDTVRYRAGKFIRRHKIGIAAVVALIVTLSAGLASTIYQKRRAEQRSQQVRQLATTFLFQIHDQIVDIAGTTKARGFVVKTAQAYLDDLAKSAGSDPELQAELAQAYLRVGEAQGSPRKTNLGDRVGAEVSYRKSSELYRSLLGRDPKYRADAVDSWRLLAFFYVNENHVDDAVKALATALSLAGPLEKEGTSRALSVLALLNETAADVDEARANQDENIRHNRLAVDYMQRWGRTQPASEAPNRDIQVGIAELRLGRALFERALLNEAEKEELAARESIGQALALEPQNARFRAADIAVNISLAALYQTDVQPSLERPADAEVYARKVIELVRPLVDADANDIGERANKMSALLAISQSLFLRNPSQGLPEARRALAVWTELGRGKRLSRNYILPALDDLGRVVPVLSRLGQRGEAYALAMEIVGQRQVVLAGRAATDDDLWYVVKDMQAAADAARAEGNESEAQRLLKEGERISRPFADAADKSLPAAMYASSFYLAQQRDSVARRNCAEARACQAKEAEVWGGLAASSEYAAMRLRRVQAAPVKCVGR